jgi:cell fate (sporulation/competence/biofilm development) regulator YlbF (YheA/YmcA/DUF963 family)
MHLDHTDTPLLNKTRELCQTILDQPDYASIRERIASFLANDEARSQYDAINAKGQALQYKQQTGIQLNADEIADFERDRDTFLKNPLAQSFLTAQQEMHQMKQLVNQYVSRTFELGRMPVEEDFSNCGAGCNCQS